MRYPEETFLHITLLEFDVLALYFVIFVFCFFLVALTSSLTGTLQVSQGVVANDEFTVLLAISTYLSEIL